MASLSDQLIQARSLEAAASESLLKLLQKTSATVSFGDQSYTLVDVEKLTKVRNQLRQEVRSLEAAVEGGKSNKSIKVSFPLC